MKKIFCMIFTIFLFLSCWARELDINKTILYSTPDWFHSEVNFFDGQHLFFYNANNFILSKEKAVWLRIEYIPTNGHSYYERYCYNQLGQVIYVESTYHDCSKDYYFYDDENRLISYGNNHTLSYPKEYAGEDYNNGKLEDSWQCSWDDNVFSINVKGGAWYYRRQFIIEYGKVVTIQDTTYYQKKIGNHYYDYKYDGNRLVKIVDRYGENDIRRVSNINYRDNQVSEIMIEYYEKGVLKSSETNVYSGYDVHKNWTVCKVYYNGEMTNSIYRKIVYCDVPDSNAFCKFVNANRVRLRKQPCLESEIIVTLDKSTLLELIDEKKVDSNDKYSWYMVKTKDNLVGWIYGEYVSER